MKKAGEKTLLIIQYGGHGVQDNYTFALTDSIEYRDMAVPIEKKLRDIAEIGGADTYILSIFDCCRENRVIPKADDAKKVLANEAGRDGSLFRESEIISVGERNIMMVFSCPPNSYTPADSTTTHELFNNIWSHFDQVSQTVKLPGNLSSWKPCNKGEVIHMTSRDLVLRLDPSI